VADKYKFRQDVFFARLRWGALLRVLRREECARYEPLPRFPAVERDFSLLLADGVKFADVTKTIQSLGIAEITSIEAADYSAEKCARRKIFADGAGDAAEQGATMTDAQIAEYSTRIVAALEKELGAQLRAG